MVEQIQTKAQLPGSADYHRFRRNSAVVAYNLGEEPCPHTTIMHDFRAWVRQAAETGGGQVSLYSKENKGLVEFLLRVAAVDQGVVLTWVPRASPRRIVFTAKSEHN